MKVKMDRTSESEGDNFHFAEHIHESESVYVQVHTCEIESVHFARTNL